MTREELKKLMEGADEAALARLEEAITAEMSRLKAELEKQTAAQNEKAKAYDELSAKYDADMQAAEERLREAEFQAMLEAALRERGVRSVKAAMALLNMDDLRSSENRKEEIRRAVEQLAASGEGAFLFETAKTGRRVDIGGGALKAAARGGSMAAIRRAAGLK